MTQVVLWNGSVPANDALKYGVVLDAHRQAQFLAPGRRRRRRVPWAAPSLRSRVVVAVDGRVPRSCGRHRRGPTIAFLAARREARAPWPGRGAHGLPPIGRE